MPLWYLESYSTDGDSVYRIPVSGFPAVVGREAGLAVVLQSNSVSRQHAELLQQNGQLLVRDLESTNGTFVNHEKVSGTRTLNPGDVVRFADVEFRLQQDRIAAHQQSDSDFTATALFAPDEGMDRMPIGAQHFERLLRNRMINPVFQPIVSAGDERMKGVELLGRGCHPELSELPMQLFSLADSLGHSIELSEVIRDVGVQAWANSTFRDMPLFVNMHPGELKDSQRLIGALQILRDKYPDVPLVLEIHEQAVTDQATLKALNKALQVMNIELAYDDFGAGQARLLELLDVPPYAVKFDISLVRDLDKMPRIRQDMVGLLVTLVKSGHAGALAEGVSRPGELTICQQLGFDLIQGFVYGNPLTLKQLEDSPRWGQLR